MLGQIESNLFLGECMAKKKANISIDNPIKSSKEDQLDRAIIAKDFARTIRKFNASEGLVVGVLGAWGSGKSSFVNLMREQFATKPSLTVVEFNPWMFSGTEQLVDSFFREISAELRIKDERKFSKIADGLSEYGDMLSPIAMIPFVGGWFDRTFKSYKTAHQWWKDRKAGSKPIRAKVSEALKELEDPVIVIIDDIDRLSTNEIRDIFKLVRLTASFPNLVYVLAFDRYRIELALDETNIPGRAYLEKIVQLSFDLPATSQDVLKGKVIAELNSILGDVKNLRLDQERWPDAFSELILPLIENLRDITRLATSARPTLEVLGADIDAVDLMTLEAIRVFKPALFNELHKHKSLLTTVSDGYGYSNDTSRQEKQIAKLIELADDDKEYVDRLISRIFPAAKRYTTNVHHGYDSMSGWRRMHRLAHIDFLSLYLERNTTEGLEAFRRAEEAFEVMSDEDKFGILLDSLNPALLNDTIYSLEAYEHAFEKDQIVPGSIVLLNRINKIPEKKNRGLFDIGSPDLTVGRVVLRMMRTLKEESDREDAATKIIAGLNTYSSRLDFMRSLGFDKGVGHKLVSEDFATEIEAKFIKDLQANRPTDLSGEWSLLAVYWYYMDKKGDDYNPFTFTNPDEIRKIFETAKSTMRSQSANSRHVRTEEHLSWDVLVKLFGDEDALKTAQAILKKKDGETPIVQLVERYINGWRPER